MKKLVYILLILIGLIAGLLLIKKSQDIREKASGGWCSTNTCMFDCKKNHDANYCTKYCAEFVLNGCITTTNCSADCKPPRKCQNGQCIGNPGNPGSGIIIKCKTNKDCPNGGTCFQGRICI